MSSDPADWGPLVSELLQRLEAMEVDGVLRHGSAPGDDEHDNRCRAGYAAAALVAFAREARLLGDGEDEEVETVVAELLMSLRHLADVDGFDYEEAERRGAQYYADSRVETVRSAGRED